MKKSILLFALIFSTFLFAQNPKKTAFSSSINILKKIVPNDPLVKDWILVQNVYSRDRTVVSSGKFNYLPKFEGFSIDSHEEGFYYIAYTKNGIIEYITQLSDLKKFIGRIDNPEEAAIIAMTSGYIIDFEYKDYASNYTDNGTYYILELGKSSSEKCPIAKNHFEIYMDKKTGEILKEVDLGRYYELYAKDCKNNPHYTAIQKQIEEAKLKAEEEKKKQKEINEKIQAKMRKNHREY